MRLRSILIATAGAAVALLARAEPQASPDTAPTLVSGLWCGSGPIHQWSLRLTQRDQAVEGELVRGDRIRTIAGTVEGNVLRTQNTKVGALVLERQGDELKITGGDGPIVFVRGQSFRRTTGAACSG